MKRAAIYGLVMLWGCVFLACRLDKPPNKSDVRYELDSDNCIVRASDFDEARELNDGAYSSRTYIWHCADYKGQDEVMIGLTFDNSNDGSQCLKLAEEEVSRGLCAPTATF